MNANQSHNYLTYVRKAVTIRQDMTSVGENVDKIEHWYTVGGSAIGSTTLENNREIPQLKMELPQDPVIIHLIIYLKDMKTSYQRDICTPRFYFSINSIWMYTKEWIHKDDIVYM